MVQSFDISTVLSLHDPTLQRTFLKINHTQQSSVKKDQ